MCGIFGITGHKDASRLAFLGLYSLQHRGEESAGIVACNAGKVKAHQGMGLVGDVFNEQQIRRLKGDVAIGHVRYSTTGSSSKNNIQPFLVNYKKGHIAIAHNGNFTNTFKMHKILEEKGSIFQSTMDSEVIVHLVAQSEHKGFKDKVIGALAQVRGAYSLVMIMDGVLIGARDPYGFRPLCLGKLNGAYVLSSETCTLDLIQAEYIRDIEPGEIVFIKDKNIESKKPFNQQKHSFCIFEYIYFARPDSNIFGSSVYFARKRLGMQLALEENVKADLIMPIPDSGNSAALGFAEKSGIAFETGMIRNHYVGRTFIQPSQFIRDFKVKVKLNPIKDVLKGKDVIVVEDSIVRGTTSKIRVKTVRDAGAKSVHMRVSCPPLKFPCFYGIDFPTQKELIAAKQTIQSIEKYLGLDSLKYLSIEGMLKSMRLPKEEFCTACFNGKYPGKIPERFSKKMLEKNR